MGKIFCIMGKSATGKDTIYKALLAREDLGLRRIVSCTTRPIRAGEADGVEYHFCTEEERDRLLALGRVIEMRSYDTCEGRWDYFTVADERIDLSAGDYLIIGTLESYCKIRDFYGKEQVVPIYIEVEDGLRLSRALERERGQQHPKYRETCRRFLADEQDFSPEKLAKAEIDRRFVNEEADRTQEEIASYIMSLRRTS